LEALGLAGGAAGEAGVDEWAAPERRAAEPDAAAAALCGAALDACADCCCSWRAFRSESLTAPRAFSIDRVSPATPGAEPWYGPAAEAGVPPPGALCEADAAPLEADFAAVDVAAALVFGDEPEEPEECPRSAISQTPSSTTRAASAIWKGREICVIVSFLRHFQRDS
jgi:hypothetical protein